MHSILKTRYMLILLCALSNITLSFNMGVCGENIMQPVYRLNKATMEKLEPKMFSTKKSKVEGLFSVPIDNTLATNKIGNAITLIHFSDDKIKYETLEKNFLDYVSGNDDGYMPLFSEDTVGYSIGRGFLLFNIKNKKFNYYSIAGHFNYKISQMISFDPSKKTFLFKIRDVSRKQSTFIRLMDLSTDTAKILKEKEVGDCGIKIRDNEMFVYHGNEIYAMNSEFENIDHPLIRIFINEKGKDFGKITSLQIHQKLPFAIIKEKKYDASFKHTTSIWVINWRENAEPDKKKMIKLLSEDSIGFKFSYDGKWLWFIDSSTSPRSLILMPVDPDLPYFIGPPIYLGELPRPENANGDAMTRNPSGLVVSECEGYKGQCWLKKWDFTEAEKLIEKRK